MMTPEQKTQIWKAIQRRIKLYRVRSRVMSRETQRYGTVWIVGTRRGL